MTIKQRSIGPHVSTRASASAPDWSGVERRVSAEDRRKPTLGTFIRGALNPRRRAGRRTSDHEFPIDWHDPALGLLAAAMLLLSLADAFLTVTCSMPAQSRRIRCSRSSCMTTRGSSPSARWR